MGIPLSGIPLADRRSGGQGQASPGQAKEIPRHRCQCPPPHPHLIGTLVDPLEAVPSNHYLTDVVSQQATSNLCGVRVVLRAGSVVTRQFERGNRSSGVV